MPLNPFQFQAYEPRSDATIADLIMAPARARAQALRTSGTAQAQAELVKGQAASQIAGTLGALANLPLQVRQQRQQEADRTLARTSEELTIAEKKAKLVAAQQDAREESQLRALFSVGTPKPEQIYQVVGPQRGVEIVKGLVALGEQNEKAFASTQQRIGAMTGGILALPEGLRPEAYAAARMNLINRGLVTPEDVPEQYDPAFLQSAHVAAMTPDKQEEVINPKPINVAGIGLVNPKTNDVVVPAPTKPEPTAPNPTEASLAMAAANGDKMAARALEIMRQQAAKNSSPLADLLGGMVIPGAEKADVSLTGEAFLKSLTPDLAAEVKAYAEGRRPFPVGISLSKLQPLIRLVGQYDPEFDASNYTGRLKSRQDFTAGASAKQITALNTVVGHLGDLAHKAEALNGTNIQAINAVKNWLKTATGSSDVTNFNVVKKGVTDELTRVWRQAGGSEQDIKTWAESLNAAQSPAQLHGTFTTIAGMLGARLEALENQKTQGLGRFGNDIQVITPKAMGILQTLGAAPAIVEDQPVEGTLGTVNGVPAVWKTVDGKAGWYAR